MQNIPLETLAHMEEEELRLLVDELQGKAEDLLLQGNYERAATLFLDLSFIEAKLFSYDLAFISLARAFTAAEQSKKDALKATVLYNHAMLLQIQKNKFEEARRIIMRGIEYAKKAEEYQLMARFLQLQMGLDLMERRSATKVGSQSREVAQYYQKAGDITGQLDALITGAKIMTIRDPDQASDLLDEAEMLLKKCDASRLKPMSTSILIRKDRNDTFPAELDHSHPKPKNIKDDWLNYINRLRVEIRKNTDDTST